MCPKNMFLVIDIGKFLKFGPKKNFPERSIFSQKHVFGTRLFDNYLLACLFRNFIKFGAKKVVPKNDFLGTGVTKSFFFLEI